VVNVVGFDGLSERLGGSVQQLLIGSLGKVVRALDDIQAFESALSVWVVIGSDVFTLGLCWYDSSNEVVNVGWVRRLLNIMGSH
jgi:hypothetical protein